MKSMKTDMPNRIIFLLSPRHEIAEIVSSIYFPLSKRGMYILPMVMDTKRAGEWEQIERIFKTYRISFKTLSDYPSLTALQILRKEKPCLVVTDNDLLAIHSCFVLSAHHLRIPVAVIRESTFEYKDNANFNFMFSEALSKMNQIPRLLQKNLFYIRSVASVKPAILQNIPGFIKGAVMSNFKGQVIGQHADFLLANTQEDEDFLKKNCPRARFIRAVGNPIFDKTIKTNITARSETRSSFKIPENKQLILFLSGSQVEHGTLSREEKLCANREILDVLEIFRDQTRVIIKLHPVEQNVFPLTWKEKYESFMQVTKYDLGKLIAASDIVITWPSTAILDAILARKPLIVMDFFNENVKSMTLLSLTAIREGAAHKVCDKNELLAALTDVLANRQLKVRLEESQRAFKSKYLGTVDGKSNKRIADAIREALVRKIQVD